MILYKTFCEYGDFCTFKEQIDFTGRLPWFHGPRSLLKWPVFQKKSGPVHGRMPCWEYPAFIFYCPWYDREASSAFRLLRPQ